LARRAGWTIERYPAGSSLFGHLKQLFALHGVDCVLDVGANCGQFATGLRRAGFTGRIVSFEPVPEAFEQLADHAKTDERWDTRQLALGDRPGRLPLNVTASTSVSSFFTPTDAYAAGYAGGRVARVENVEVARLDDILNHLPTEARRYFLKVDTQGYDLAVVNGAAGCIDRIVGLQIELSVMPIYEGAPEYLDALRFVHDRGFSPSGMFPVVSDHALRVYEFDGVFVRTDA
jgi:FkbM family methyltransferase